MAETIGQYQVSTYTTPANNSALSSSVVRGTLNTGGTAHNGHDADAGIHLQSSALASRPVAGTVGRKWLTTDGLRLYYDTGAVWSEIAYLSLAAGGTVAGAVTLSAAGTALAVTNNVTIGGTLAVTGAITATGGVVGAVTGNASTATALQTSRTIWGQSFNGSANVSGALSGATTGSFSSDVAVGGTLAVTGTSSLSGNVTVGNNIFLGTTNNFVSPAVSNTQVVIGTGGVTRVTVADATTTIANALAVTGAATFNGNVTLGDATADTVTVTGTATFGPNPAARGLVRTTTDTRVSVAASTTTLDWSLFTGFGQQTVLEYQITSGATSTLTINVPSATQIETLTGLGQRGHTSLFFKIVNTSGNSQDFVFPTTAGQWALNLFSAGAAANNSVIFAELLFFRNSGGTVSAMVRSITSGTGWLSTVGPGLTSFVS